MKNLLFIFSILTLFACNNNDEVIQSGNEVPLQINDLRINLESVASQNSVTTINREEELKINYDLITGGLLSFHESYLLLNNNPELKFYLFRPANPRTSELSFSYVFDDLKKILIEGRDFYQTKSGNQLHFYINTKNDSGERREQRFVVELE